MGYEEITNIANDMLDFLDENYNLDFEDLMEVYNKLGEFITCIGESTFYIEEYEDEE